MPPSWPRRGCLAAAREPRTAAAIGAPVTAVTGVRYALDPGQGRSSVPVRSAVLGLALSAAAVAGAVTFGANLLHLVNTPRLYGQDWDAAVDLQFSTISRHDFDAIAARVPAFPAGHSASTAPSGSATRSCPRSAWPQAAVRCCPRRCWPARVRAVRLTSCSGLRYSAPRGCESAVARSSRRRPPAANRADRRTRGLSLLRRGQLHADRYRRRRGSARGAARAAGRGFQRKRIQLRAGPVRTGHPPGGGDRRAGAGRRARSAPADQSTCVVVSQRPNGVDNYARIDGTPEVLAVILAVLAWRCSASSPWCPRAEAA